MILVIPSLRREHHLRVRNAHIGPERESKLVKTGSRIGRAVLREIAMPFEGTTPGLVMRLLKTKSLEASLA